MKAKNHGARYVLAAGLLTAALTVPSAAAPRTDGDPSGAPSRSGDPGAVYDRVAHFYGAYIDVAHDQGDDALAGQLRDFYLTADLRTQLDNWEKQHNADGVLRAQNAPSAWKVTPGDSGMGKTYTTVRLTWGNGEHTYLTVQSDLATKKITDITSKS